jgi:D-glycero-D-manno-heptose 1,7-bisphosphate phosphatase
MSSGRPAVFLDRDGTVIEDVVYLDDPAGVRLLDGAADGLAALRRAGFALVVVSNQSGIGRGLISPERADAVHRGFMDELRRAGVEPDDVRYCPHAPDAACECRKPSPRLLLDSARELGLDLAGSFMVGDKPSDAETGRNAGCRTILLGASNGGEADHVADSWADVVAFVLGAEK